MRWIAVVAAAVGGGCLESNVTRCDDGRLCPTGTQCVASLGCVLDEQIASCDDLADGASCRYSGVDDGACLNGACIALTCGDDRVSESEECDGDPTGEAADCLTYGYYDTGPVTCTAACRLDFRMCTGYCGDGTINGDEPCDPVDRLDVTDDLLGDQTCLDFGYYAPDGLTCSSACTLDSEGCTHTCGDGVLDLEEECDDAGTQTADDDVFAGDCLDLGFYEPSTIRCTSSCGYDDTACAGFCGDRAVGGDEACDGVAPVGQTCLDFGYEGGRLGCGILCGPDTSRCHVPSWSAESSGTTADLHAVWSPGPGDAFAVTFDATGSILRWNGASWSVMANAGTPLEGIWGLNANDVYAVGYNTVLHWNGTAWSSTGSFGGAQVQGVWGSASNNVYVSSAGGAGGTIFRWDGATWGPGVTSGSCSGGRSMWGFSASDIWSAYDKSVCHYNGTTWTRTILGVLLDSFHAIWGSAPTDVFVVGQAGGIRHWNGTAWTTMTSGTNRDLYSVWGTGPDDVFAVGKDGVALHYDGASWTQVVAGSTTLEAVTRTTGREMLAVGAGGTVLRWRGDAWATSTTPTANELFAVYHAGPDDAFAVGAMGTILRWSGGAWSAMTSGTTNYLYGVSGTGPSDVYAVGGQGTILHWDGTQWLAQTSGVTHTFYSVWALPTGDVFASADHGLLQRAGGTWTEIDGSAGSRQGVWATSATDAFIVGYDGLLQHWDGTSATSMAHPPLNHLYAVWGASTDNVFAVGAKNGTSGIALHWDGTAWTEMDIGAAPPLDSVFGSGPSDVYASGRDGTILHFDGIQWSADRAITASELNGVSAGRDVLAVGAQGLALRRQRACLGAELRCDDGGDDDCDGLIDCGDDDCACTSLDPCAGAVPIACGDSIAGTTTTGDSVIDAYACDPWNEVGRETTFALTPSASGTTTISLTGMTRDLDLIVLADGPGGTCDPTLPTCVAASSTTGEETVTLTADPAQAYYVIVESIGTNAGAFTLGVTCP